MAALAARLYGEPARAMTMIGVTGTKGKTTTAHLLAAVLQADGRRVGLVGTNGVCWPGHRHDLNHTTPESCDLQLLLRRMADDGCDTCVMEVSSLGLKFDRAAEIEFAVGVFTNLSPDHIGPDEHADFAEYLFWKRALFRRCRVGVFNNDDPHVGKIMQGLSCRAVTYGIGCPADVRADADFALTRAGGRLGAAFTVDGARYAVGMPGAFSVYNALAALTAARVLGAGEDAIHAGLAGAVVCGRVEPVPLDAPFTVVIDYAHSPNALENILTLTVDAFENEDVRMARQVEPLEEIIDILVERLRDQHIKRLKDGACSIDTGVVFLDVLNNAERISDHCSNVAARLVGMEAGEDYDSHTLKNMMHHNPSKDYMLNYEQCRKNYLVPLEEMEA